MTDYDLLADLGIIIPVWYRGTAFHAADISVRSQWEAPGTPRAGRGDPCGDPPIELVKEDAQ
jgi:hypothetical protein